MSATTMLNRIEGVKPTGQGRWLARCPAHDDRRPSLSIRELDDGRVLIHDFGGCGVDAVLAAIGLEMSDLFPKHVDFPDHRTRRSPPIPASDILEAVAHEVAVVVVVASDLMAGAAPAPEDLERLGLAFRRVTAAVEVCRGAR